jgi:predicted DsbA family dithiol-disulfide isomerase
MTESSTQSKSEHPGEPLRVAVFADFVCPYSYLAVDQLDRLARDYGLRPLWRPHWLHPDTPREGLPHGTAADMPAKLERLHAWIKEMAPEQYPKIRFPDKRQYSFLAFEALELAFRRGREWSFKTAVYDMMWTEGRDIGEPDTLVEAAGRSGLDPREMKIALDEHWYGKEALASVEQSRDLGITNTPTIFLGRTRINGWHYYEVLQEVVEKQGARPLRAAESA